VCLDYLAPAIEQEQQTDCSLIGCFTIRYQLLWYVVSREIGRMTINGDRKGCVSRCVL
jgi:hypothetical protein